MRLVTDPRANTGLASSVGPTIYRSVFPFVDWNFFLNRVAPALETLVPNRLSNPVG